MINKILNQLLWIAFIIITILGAVLIKIVGENKSYKSDIDILQSRLDKTITETNKKIEEAKIKINLLVEDNNSLLIENRDSKIKCEELEEEVASLIIAAETSKKLLEENTPVNNYAVITLSDSERDLLARILALEAGDQPDCGQRAVVEVVFNRILTGWADTVEEVIYQKGQFATVKYLNKPYQTPDEQEYSNIDYVLGHGSTILPPDYVFFATYKANGKDFLQIQDHYFGRGK